MLNWVEYRKELLGRIGEIGKITPDMLQGRTAKEPSKMPVGEEEQSRSHGLAR